jgi:putative FmdB family regulatory protein
VPLYEYKCLKCGRNTEKIESVAGPHLKKCPHCGGKVERQLTAAAIQFKGAGWYVTDYAKKSSGGSEKAEKPAAETKEPGKEKEAGGKETNGGEPKEKKHAKKK